MFELLTLSNIAVRLNVSRNAALYAVRAMGINPSATAGRTSVFSEADIPKIQKFISARQELRSLKTC